jgi:hypothetical protein
MFEQVMDNYRKAAEATLQMQQELFQQWTQQWGQVPESLIPGVAFGNGWAGQLDSLRRKWAATVTDILNKHHETLDTQYRAGIRTIEDAFRVGEAKDPEQYRKLVEELWRQSFACLSTVVESHMRDLQTAAEKWFEAASKSVPTTTKL